MLIVHRAAKNRATPWVLFVAAVALFVVAWILPVTAQKKPQSLHGSDTFKELLIQHQGEKTSLGVLKKIGADYIVVEADESTTAMYPIEAIQGLKVVKGDEGEPTKVVIMLLAKD